jgi:hypothetical protein
MLLFYINNSIISLKPLFIIISYKVVIIYNMPSLSSRKEEYIRFKTIKNRK